MKLSLRKIKDDKGMKTVVAKQIKLFLLNNNDHDGIIDCINQKGEDKLANVIRINAWKKIELIDEEISLAHK